MINFIGRIFKLKDWADWRRNLSNSQFVKHLVLNFLNIDQFKRDKAKNFDTMAKRYHVSDEQLTEQAKALLLLCLVFLVATLLLWTYIFFHIYSGNYAICVVISCFSCIPIAMAFRYHFYYTAIKYKRLNLTIKDWIKLNLSKE